MALLACSSAPRWAPRSLPALLPAQLASLRPRWARTFKHSPPKKKPRREDFTNGTAWTLQGDTLGDLNDTKTVNAIVLLFSWKFHAFY